MILKPLEFLYHLGSGMKNFFYDRDWLSSEKLNVPVVSIGNLSFGGTGKTPFIEFLASHFKDQKIVIICRSYKASLSGPQKVNLNSADAAEIYGDEAALLQKKLPQCSVWSGPQKWKTALEAASFEKPNLIFVDDGFSHRQLRRDFDLVLIDATKLENDYFRENLGSLKRATAVVLTKIQDADQPAVQVFKQKLIRLFPLLQNSIFESGVKSHLEIKPGSPVFAFCGIAKPEAFQQSLMRQNASVVHFESFADHQNYTNLLQEKIWNDYKQHLVQNPHLKIVTTEKDFNKIKHPELRKNLIVGDYQVEMQIQQKENLIEKIRHYTQS